MTNEDPKPATASVEAPATAPIPATPATVAETTPATPVALGPAPKRGFFGRVVEWFWGSGALKSMLRAQKLPSAHALELNRRAHAALEIGKAVLEPAQPYEYAPVDAIACDLYGQSVYWSLAAQRALHGETDLGALPATPFDSVWKDVNQELLLRAAGDREAADALGRAIVGKSYTDYAALAPDEQARLARTLRAFAESLCDDLDTAQFALEKIWMRRVVRLAGVAVLVALVAWGASVVADKNEQARDIAHGRPWTASSRYPDGGCTSPDQECVGSPMYFFSTNEEDSPWVEFDLGTAQAVSSVRVANRTDCCSERAVPLVVELSTDHLHWKEVARRTDEFRSWKAKFPTEQARWVRLRVPRRTNLHFTGVRIFH